MFQPLVIAVQMTAPNSPGAIIIVTACIAFFRALFSAISVTFGDAVFPASLTNIYTKRIVNASSTILEDLKSYGINVKLLQTNNFILH